jgi:N-hydroxyarylamine O-acetyltransferase
MVIGSRWSPLPSPAHNPSIAGVALGPAPEAELLPGQLAAYLRRLGLERAERPSLPFLTRLQRRHLLRVPFENLDIFWGKPIPLDVQRAWSKVMELRRGGFCYELNGLFASALSALGFHVSLLSARVWRKAERNWGPEFDHLTLAVTLDQTYLVEVGFGDAFRAPMPLSTGVQSDVSGTYRLVEGEWPDELVLEHAVRNHWRSLYRVSREPRALQSFAGMNSWHQTASASPFTGHAVFTLARPWGRLTLTDRNAIETRNGRIHRVRLRAGELERRLRRLYGVRGALGHAASTMAA